MMTSSDVRDKLVEALVLDLIGPIADPTRAEERLDQSPSRWYLTGFLVPRARPSMDLTRAEKDDEEDLFGSDDDPVDEPTADTLPMDDSDKAAVVVTSKRHVLPSSIGLSVLVPRPCVLLEVTVRWGDYHPEYARGADTPESEVEAFALEVPPSSATSRKQRKIIAWSRRPREQAVTLRLDGTFDRPREQAVPNSDGLRLVWLSRPAPREALDEQLVPDGRKRSTSIWSTRASRPPARRRTRARRSRPS